VPSGSHRHRIGVVEDDPATLNSLCRMLNAYGRDAVGVRSLLEAREILDSGTLCALVTDLGILADPHDVKPEPELGFELVEYARHLFPAHAESPAHTGPRWYLFPVIVTSGLDTPKFRDAMLRGASDFLQKPLGSNNPTLKETLELWLGRAERTDHAACAEATRRARGGDTVVPLRTETPSEIRLGVTGRMLGKKSEITLDGAAVTLPNHLFAPLLKLIETRLAGVDSVSRDDLGAEPGSGWRGKSNIHKELRAALRGRALIQNDKGRGYRLADDVELDAIVAKPLADGMGGLIVTTARAILALQARKKRTGT
jgi:CheY-like chemotaxis protein